jgi:hypothetical protein
MGYGEKTMVALTNRNDCISGTCRSCSKSVSIMVNGQDVVDWKSGTYIQDAMPYLSVDEREILISGTCGTCFDKMFGGGE